MIHVHVALIGWFLLSGSVLGVVVPEAARSQEMAAVGPSERQVLLEEVVTPFLDALQTGDALALEQLIGGKLALTLGTLLRENTAYPDFLRQRYRGTIVQAPIEIVQPHEGVGTALAHASRTRVAVVQLQTPAGRPDHFQLNLEQDAQGAWKVVDKQMVR